MALILALKKTTEKRFGRKLRKLIISQVDSDEILRRIKCWICFAESSESQMPFGSYFESSDNNNLVMEYLSVLNYLNAQFWT